MTTPLLAMPALTIAICSGVTRTSYWPIADCARLRLVELGREPARRRPGIGIRSVVAEAELGRLVGERLRRPTCIPR